MEWRAKVELFEEIRREYEFGVGTIKGVAKKLGVHRRMVRQALNNALPPTRKVPEREQPKLAIVKEFIDRILADDRKAPRKQRHSAVRIYQRVKKEFPDCEISESTVCHYVSARKTAQASQEVFVPQTYRWGCEAQIDWYEAYALIGTQQEKVQCFSMRSMASGGAFHRAYPRATQQAFFEAHEKAFHYFGGVFKLLRYDNLKSAVKKVLRGHTREENARFIAFRSHWKFEAQFCTPGIAGAHEKGGVEGEAGYFRRNHWVPIPAAADFTSLNEQLLAACREDEDRLIGEREQVVGQSMIIERESLLPLAKEGFQLEEISFPVVDTKRCVRVRNNFYSTPLKPLMKAQVRLLPERVEICSAGKLVATHPRCYGSGHQILNLEHYLDVLAVKPGAFAGSKPLAQWRAEGRWPVEFDQLWQSLQVRLGKQEGTRAMVELLILARQYGYEKLSAAIAQALTLRCSDGAAVQYLMIADGLSHRPVAACDIGALTIYERPLPQLDNYDALLEVVR